MTKVATLAVPHTLNKPRREHLIDICLSMEGLEAAIRWNGNGGHMIPFVENETLFIYPPNGDYLSQGYTVRPPDEEETAGLLEKCRLFYPKYDLMPKENKAFIFSSVASLVGYGNRPSDVLLHYTVPESTLKPIDTYMYKELSYMATKLGIKTVPIGRRNYG